MNLQVIEERNVLDVNFIVYGTFEEPLLLARDVAEWIGYDISSINKMLDSVDDEEKLVGTIFRSGQNREMWFLTEEGLYEVLMLSRKENAKKFKKEVKKILKSIRKTGSYNTLAPTNMIEALQLALEQAKQIQALESDLSYAIATKAEIGARREATAMNTASQARKEVKRLEIELDRSKDFASVKAIEAITKQKYSWRPLRNYCTANELDMKKIFDANYGEVNTYPSIAWKEVYNIILEDII